MRFFIVSACADVYSCPACRTVNYPILILSFQSGSAASADGTAAGRPAEDGIDLVFLLILSSHQRLTTYVVCGLAA